MDVTQFGLFCQSVVTISLDIDSAKSWYRKRKRKRTQKRKNRTSKKST